MHEVQFNGEPMLLHLEFQKKSDPEMGQRLLEYNMIGMLTYKLPVWSCVL
ncbi:MAG: hypothetical protein H0W02_23360 [Ktedonobacteraceae bacterium]|nr:hypothetical protein [Ktedonobacteraceae bacterium]